ncbi:MAG: hypothetical protein Q9166_001051 [cf. Caloplaca sp. 2 TL-2023]
MDKSSNKRGHVYEMISDDKGDSDSDVVEIPAPARPAKTQRRVPTNNVRSSPRASISPPPTRNASRQSYGTLPREDKEKAKVLHPGILGPSSSAKQSPTGSPWSIPSPIQLSTVKGLAASANVDTVGLKDILGDPLIKECWLFNYLIDIDFVMSQLDEDTRDLVQVKIVHGSWKEEDVNRINIEEAAKKYENVQVVTAYMAEMYGTHHSKMIILFRHDDTAQINIVTGNFIIRDWSMCQAVWRSPLLLIQRGLDPSQDPIGPFAMGSGLRFKKDVLAYLGSYGHRRTGSLIAELRKYDFSSVRAALIASVPGKQDLRSTDQDQETLWGWPGLRHILRSINPSAPKAKPHVVMQCSSVASISKKWMDNFQNMLRLHEAFDSALSPKPKFSLVFPTADEIRRSVDGYACGGSIHMKTQTPAQLKQLEMLRPILSHWAGDEKGGFGSVGNSGKPVIRQAQRRRAAPHIKTYTRFSNQRMETVDWAIMTSANLSKQAWGEEVNAKGEVRICSYEIGVVVWPALWDGGGDAEMVPVFGKDMPDDERHEGIEEREGKEEIGDDETTDGEGSEGVRDQEERRQGKLKTRIGLRMPYDLPLVPYAEDEMPWCASTPCAEPDWMGRTWPGFGSS